MTIEEKIKRLKELKQSGLSKEAAYSFFGKEFVNKYWNDNNTPIRFNY